MYPTMSGNADRDSHGLTSGAPRPEAVSVERAAALVGCHVNTIRRLIWAGKLKAFRVGRVIRIRRDVLNAFTKER